MAILWQNIVLEVPLQFTKVEDLSKFHGDGWKLISEEEIKMDGVDRAELRRVSTEIMNRITEMWKAGTEKCRK